MHVLEMDGFEATDELTTVWGLNMMKSVDDFKEANHFDVGAQDWVYGDKDGNIAWYPSHRLPIRPNKDYPPFLPLQEMVAPSGMVLWGAVNCLSPLIRRKGS